MASTLDILRRLNDSGVEFVVVGGLAGVAHGSALVTEDVDVCAPLNRQNLGRILTALGDVNPRFRTTPNRPPLPRDPSCLVGYKNLYLITDLGQIDFLSEITGVGDYGQVSRHTIKMDLAGVPCQVLDLDTLIQSKTALGRAKDLRAAMELDALRHRLGKGRG
jgi:hypothetical protein